MRLTAEIIGLWIVSSCIVGPCLTWLFYYGKRRERFHQGSMATPGDICKIACNIDPLRGLFAPNSDPL
jgi:hypothetical protein